MQPDPNGTVQATLDAADYKPDGELKTREAELSLVVGAASKAEQYIASSQWSLLWRDADLNIMGASY